MKYRKQLMTYNITSRLRSAIAGCKELTLLCAALALDGCGKPAPRPPEKALVSTAAVQPMDDLRSDAGKGVSPYIGSLLSCQGGLGLRSLPACRARCALNRQGPCIMS